MGTKAQKSFANRTRGMIESNVQGIPCLIDIETYNDIKPWKGSALSCPSSDDYYGYVEIEFTVYDRKGYRSNWLQDKMNSSDVERIEEEIMETKTVDYDEYEGC
jgi:hypothetical protein